MAGTTTSVASVLDDDNGNAAENVLWFAEESRK